MARDLTAAKEKISEKEEEVQELKSERNNTRVSRRSWEGGGGGGGGGRRGWSEVEVERERDGSG